jgi:hypothetical protein
VDSNSDPSARSASEADEIQKQIRALTDASMERQRLVRGTPEYAVALETEERLATDVWALATSRDPSGGAVEGPDPAA